MICPFSPHMKCLSEKCLSFALLDTIAFAILTQCDKNSEYRTSRMGDFRQLPGESPRVFCFHFITKCQCCQTCAHWFTTSESCNCLRQCECVLLSMHVVQSHLTSVFTLLVQQGDLTVVAVVTAYLVCLVDVGGIRERRREGVIVRCGVGVSWWRQVGLWVRLGRGATEALILPRRWSSTVAQGLSFSQLIAQLRHLLLFLKKTKKGLDHKAFLTIHTSSLL